MYRIRFRGKAINRNPNVEYRTDCKNGDWVYGLVSKLYNAEYDFPAEMTNDYGVTGIDVDYTTLGQYTGFIDINGKEIYEDDIVKNTTNGLLSRVTWYQEYGGFLLYCKSERKVYWLYDAVSSIEVIGNTYDNPELLSV